MQRINDTENNIRGERFESFDEMYSVNEAREFATPYRGVGDRDAKDRREIKDGVSYTWEQTKQAIMYGSTEFDEEFREIKKGVAKQVRNVLSNYQRNVTRKDVVGSTVSVGRALAGHPQPFNRRVPSMKKQKTVHLMFNITCKWSTSTRDRLTAGCILMAITEVLEKMDYQVAITYTPYFSYERSENPSMLAEVQIKDYKTRFNQRKIQFPVAAESVLFQLGCWWMHRCPDTEYDFGYGEGKCVDYDRKRLSQAKKYAQAKKAVYLSTPMIHDDFGMSVQKTLDYVLEQIGKM